MSLHDELKKRGLTSRRADGSTWPKTPTAEQLQAEIDRFDSLPQKRLRAHRRLQAAAAERKTSSPDLTGPALMAVLPILIDVASGKPLTPAQSAKLNQIAPLLRAAAKDAAAELDAAQRINSSDNPEQEAVIWPTK